MIAVTLQNISKVYRFYQKPAHRLWEALCKRSMHTPFHALEDISFSVPVGSTMGIIGENGAGKSTLLKILARTLTPSSGTIEVNGRVSALLELGAGFHEEFSGRQNIYLNASLMGLSENEIRAREEEIISFSELGEFIDRPIKTYSSGMVVRLAFSIATSVDPDVLVVDEALSVGDQRFQEKCIHRMQGFREDNKTIIVCSHSMYLINALCGRCMWIDHGRIRHLGQTDEVISSYVAYLENNDEQDQPVQQTWAKAPEVQIEECDLLDMHGKQVSTVHQFSYLHIVVHTRCIEDGFCGHMAIVVEDPNSNPIFSAFSKDSLPHGIDFHCRSKVGLAVPSFPLQKGGIYIKALISDEHGMRLIDEKRWGPLAVTSNHPEYGLMWMEHQWQLE